MRQIILFAAIAVSVSVSAQHNNHDDKNRIEGSGNIITKDFPVQSFDELKASGVYSLELKQGTEESVKIEGDDNLLDLFEVKNDGNKLTIAMKKESNFNSKKSIHVYVSFKSLKNLDLNMVGNTSSGENLSFSDLKIKNQNVGAVNLKMTAQSLNVENNSVGNITLGGKADQATIRNNGVGSIQAGEFIVQKMDIDNSGIGSATVNAVQELKVKDSFLGKVANRGAATMKKTNKVVI
jgi:hypothetical protein